MTRARAHTLLLAGWIVATSLLVFAAGVSLWLVAIGNFVGAAVIGNYVRGLPEAPPSRAERALRTGAYAVLGTVAAVLSLLLAVTMVAFLVAWIAG